MGTIHLVSHTHWDREWYLPFQSFRLKLVALVDHLLDLLASDPDYRYFLLDGQTIILEDYLQMRPERRDELREHVHSGRVLIGPWYILPDEFLVSPEATIRNLLQGRRTAREFGEPMAVGYSPDPFGHIGQMPQILLGFGIQYACVQRGVADEPCEFWWKSPDGSQVFMGYLRDSYANAALLLEMQGEEFAQEVRREVDSLLPFTRSSHFLLMQGNDHTSPAAQTSAAIHAARPPLEPDLLLHSNLPAYLHAAREEILSRNLSLPVVEGELRASRRHNLLPGVLSTRVSIKQRNHACETLLEKWAEPFSTFASFHQLARGEDKPDRLISNPAPILRQAWRLLMECHPHDSICGSSIDQVHAEMRPRFDQVEQIGEEITRQSLESLALAADTASPDIPAHCLAAILVFNPMDGPRSDTASFSLQIPSGLEIEIVDAAGDIMPCELGENHVREIANEKLNREDLANLLGGVQGGRVSGVMTPLEGMSIQEVRFERRGVAEAIDVTLSAHVEPNQGILLQAMQHLSGVFADPGVESFILNAHVDARQVSFVARQVPGFGYKTFWARPAKSSGQPPVSSSPMAIENEYFRLEASEDGTLLLTDKRNGQIFPGLNHFVDGGDCGDEYNYCPPAQDLPVTAQVQSIVSTVRPAQQSLAIQLTLQVPADLAPDRQTRSPELVEMAIVTHASLAPGVPRVDIHTVVENPARDHRLRVHFPAPFDMQAAGEKAAYDGHFEVILRPTVIPPYDDSWTEWPRPEHPQRAFVDLSDGLLGLMIANRGLREAEALCPRLGLVNELGQAEIALTLLRCVGWLSRDDLPNRRGHAGPGLPTPEAQMIGRWEFDYAIIPHRGGWEQACQQAYAFNTPFRAAVTNQHSGSLPPVASMIAFEPPEFLVSAIKAAEDGDGWILRGYNLGAVGIKARVRPWKRFSKVERISLAEESLETIQPEADGSFMVPVQGYQIASLRFRE
jgi:alpha-mannosidase